MRRSRRLAAGHRTAAVVSLTAGRRPLRLEESFHAVHGKGDAQTNEIQPCSWAAHVAPGGSVIEMLVTKAAAAEDAKEEFR